MQARWLAPWIVMVFLVGCGGGSKKPASSDPQDAIDRLDTPGKIRVAQSFYQNGRAQEAVEVLEKAIEDDPGSAAVRNYQGQLLLLIGRYPEAEAALRAALEIDPYMTDAHNNLGVVYDRMGDKVRAEESFRTALADHTYPTPEKVHLNLGLLYESQGRRDDAIAELRRSVAINTTFYQGHYELAGLLEKEGKLIEAAELYEVAAPLYRTSAEYHFRLGLTYFRLEDRIRAREHFNRVRELSPGSETAAQAAEYLGMMG